MQFRRTHTPILCLILCLMQAVPLSAQSYAPQSLLASGQWYKIPVSTSGVYKVTTAQLPALSQISCDKICLYGAPGDMLSVSNTAPHPDDLTPAAIQIVDLNGNGLFDSDDYLLFYGEAPNTWRYVAADQRFEYNVHAYANYNCYYLTIDGTSQALNHVQTRQPSSATPTDLPNHTAVALFHDDRINTHGGGQIWVSDKFSPSSPTHTYTLSLPSPPADSTLKARYALASISTLQSSYQATLGASTRQHTFPNSNNYIIFREEFSAVTSASNTFQFTYQPREANAAGYFDFIELNAQVPLVYQGGQQLFRNKELLQTSTPCRFTISGLIPNLQVWDITNPSQPSQLTIAQSGSTFSFQFNTDSARTFVAFTPADALIPASVDPLPNQNIHGATPADYIIVSHPDFLDQANRLADLHRTHQGLSVMVVTPEQVYNEFSSGKQDPVAIRQMLRCLSSHSDTSQSKPRYLLLFGKGTHDNRDILGFHQTTVVTYQSPTSFDSEGTAFPSDDLYGHLSDYAAGPFEGTLSVSIGRLPAKNLAEATHLVDKIENYMLRSDLSHDDIRGDWRNYVALLADDADPSCPYDTNFASDSERLARRIKNLYPHFNIDRIYADAYIQQSGADGSYYPDVNNALRQRMDYGCLLLNYIGHGSSNYIGTERFMEFSDIDKYTNTERLAFFVTSTCTFGKYDLVGDICGAEAFILADAAGIGIVSAARPIHHVQRFNSDVCTHALNPDNSIGDALRLAKNATSVPQCITLLGDPALHLSIPQNQVVVTHINQMPVNPAVTDSAQVLSRVTVQGEIRDPQGNTLTDFNGLIYPIVFDREVNCRTLANDNDSTEVNFKQQKSILYKGRETVTDGTFSYSFIVPRDVSYRYDYAKLSHYARTLTDDATGQYSNIMFGGFNDDIAIGDLYPDIQLYIGDTTFRNGGLTNETPTLYARLSDSIGINAAGSGLGHDITALIDGNPYSTVILNDFFEPDITDSRNGQIRYTLGKLDDGPHTLTLKCWNIFNHSASATIQFYVANDRTPQLGTFHAAPNPASLQTTIRVEHNLPTTIQSASIDIYDIRGTLLRTLTPTIGSCVLSAPWDFTAANGSRLPRGIYIARISATTADGTLLTQTTKIVHN